MFERKKYSVSSLMTVVFVAAALLMTGCESKSQLDESEQYGDLAGAEFTVTASPAALTIGATAVVELKVELDGQGVPNQIVVFTVQDSEAGYFTPATDTTDAAGLAATVFTATSIGAAVINVYVGSYPYPASTNMTVSETAQSGSGNVDVSVSPSLLLANGADTAIVSITVRDGAGQPAPDSTLVRIVAGEKFVDVDGNGYWSNGIDSLVFDANANGQWDALGLIPSTAVTTGGDGTVTVNYVSGGDAQTVYVRATVDDHGISGFSETSLQVSPDATVDFIYLYADSINLCVAQTGGIEVAIAYAVCYDVNANTVPEGLPVTFVITDGPGGNEHLGTVGYGPYETVTNSQGVAMVPVHSGSVSGTIRMRASSDEVLSNATQVMVSAGPPVYIVIGAEECNVDYWNDVGFENNIVAVVSDIYLNPVNDSTVVYFKTDEGTMKSHEARTGDLEGIAHTKWFAGTQVADADGRVLIIAETAGGTVADTSMFYNTHYPDTLIVVGVPGSMPADGKSKVYVWVTGLDLNDNPVIGGTLFSGEANYLQASGGKLENGCYSASDRVELRSTVLDMDYSLTGANDDGIGAVDLVVYWHAAGAVTSYAVTITTSTAYSGNSSIALQGSPGGGEVAYFTVTIKDRAGNPLGDHTIQIGGGGTIETNAYGEAYFAFNVPVAPGDYTVVVTDTDPRGGLVLTYTITVDE